MVQRTIVASERYRIVMQDPREDFNCTGSTGGSDSYNTTDCPKEGRYRIELMCGWYRQAPAENLR